LTCSPEYRDGFVPGYNIRTDLALEANEVIREGTAAEIPGVKEEIKDEDGIKVTKVTVLTDEASSQLGKPIGKYVTIESPDLKKKSASLQNRISQILAREITEMAGFHEKPGMSILVIGLGNWNVTPDALGPKVVEDLLVTRHIFDGQDPFGLSGKGFRRVAALSPGVMGLTGIETSEIIQGVAQRIDPDLIIAVDALAAYRLERLHTTVQLSDTGVVPGSGVKNERMAINQSTMGVPTIAIGVPTVVGASTIANEAINVLIEEMKRQSSEAHALANALENLNWEERKRLIEEVQEPFIDQLMVTPKEIDTFMDDISMAIAGGLNEALHPGMAETEADKFLQ